MRRPMFRPRLVPCRMGLSGVANESMFVMMNTQASDEVMILDDDDDR